MHYNPPTSILVTSSLRAMFLVQRAGARMGDKDFVFQILGCVFWVLIAWLLLLIAERRGQRLAPIVFKPHELYPFICHGHLGCFHVPAIANKAAMNMVVHESSELWFSQGVAPIYNGILFSHKKKRSWVICSEVDGPRVCHTEWSQSEREKQIPYANTYIWNLKKKKNGYEEPRGRTGIKTQM